MLELRNISKSYPQRGKVLDSLGLSVGQGETVAITGPSGSGKTTILNLIALLDKPDSGEILFEESTLKGYDNDAAADYRNRNIGFVFQDHLLLPYLTIRENIVLPLLARNLSKPAMEEEIAYGEELMSSVGISSLADKYPSEVSGGEAQRTSLVRALITRPSLLLADEPTGSLDSANAEMLADLLSRINTGQKISIIAATHSPMLSARMRTRYRLDNGSLVSFS